MTDENRVGSIVTAWYAAVLDGGSGAARAARARLRRCQTPAEALALAETHELFSRLRTHDHGSTKRPDQLALLATTFAHLKDIRGDALAITFGRKLSRDGPRQLSELRFQALIRASNHRELIRPLRRCLAVLGSKRACDGWRLAEDLYWWGERERNRWCFQYFGASPAETHEEEEIVS